MPLRLSQRPGMELTMVIVIMMMVSAIGLATLQMVSSQSILSNREIRQQQIFQIAEAGVNYYRWRLAHYPNDYRDGTGAAGPYVHDFSDTTGKVIGKYELTITPPVTGSTISTISSSGYLLSQPNAKRTLIVQMGLPSLSKYAVVANADMRFGVGTETFGPVHSNGGIHFDGIAHGLVSSALTTYTDPDGYGTKAGVWSLNNEAATFLGGKQVGVTAINFNGISVNLAALKTLADSAGGLLLPPSSTQGYHLTFNTNDTVDIRRVEAQLRCQYLSSSSWYDFGYCSNDFNHSCTSNSNCRVCSNDSGRFCTSDGNCSGSGTCVDAGTAPSGQCIWSSHSIGTRAADQTVYQLGVPLPNNGIIFVPEDVWVDGTIDGARVTVVAAADPITTGNANIYINEDLKYTNTNGSDVIGLIAQNNIFTGFFSKDTIRIDAALIAQKGRVGRPYYGASFTSSTNNGNFRLFPTSGMCVNNTSRSCTVNSDCINFCAAHPSTSCSNGNSSLCNNYCLAHPTRLCPGGNALLCNNYCQNDTAKSCTATGNCINYCRGDRTRSCASDTQCNRWCTGNHNKGCTNNTDCTGFGTCSSAAPDVGPCQTTSTGACITGDTCVTGDSCVTGDTCSLSKNPAGGTTCKEYRSRASLTAYGSLATNQRYGFAWTGTNLFDCTTSQWISNGSCPSGHDCNDSGYCDRTLTFDSNLIYAPPPSFPTSGEYSIISYIEQ